jgi:hypothetical protein
MENTTYNNDVSIKLSGTGRTFQMLLLFVVRLIFAFGFIINCYFVKKGPMSVLELFYGFTSTSYITKGVLTQTFMSIAGLIAYRLTQEAPSLAR